MNNFYLYKFDYKDDKKLVSATVIFCDRDVINEDILRSEIKRFYEEHYQTDKVFVIGPEYLKESIKEIFIDRLDSTFKGIPKRQETFLEESLYLVYFDKLGSLISDKELPGGFLSDYLNQGLQQIFIKRGGLVTAEGAHHFVFPSGKHCDKFLRTGNILLFSSEIYFIGFSLLKHFDEDRHLQIYCDTSSINSIAFALIDLKNRFIEKNKRKQIPIESFSSYEGLYQNPVPYTANALLLISASTSANIIGYILDLHKMISRTNILILYFLGDATKLANIKDQLICNLNKSEDNVNGIPIYKTYKEGDCELCKKGSYAVKVSGDVFLLEKPHINKVLIGVKDPDPNLSEFVRQFMSKGNEEHVLKVNYKESPKYKYEIYLDFYEILKGIKTHDRYKRFREKLQDYINQFVPSNTKYIITLNDKASIEMGEYIVEQIKANYDEKKLPSIITQDELLKIDKQVTGSVVIIGSCISNGKNLLYISRALRKYDKLKIIYFIGISRTRNLKYLNGLKANLKQGKYGGDTNSFHEVETIFCENKSKGTSWLVEVDFLIKFIEFLRKKDVPPNETISFLEERKKKLMLSQGDHIRGLANDLFLPRVVVNKFEHLKIRKNFAFFKFDGYVDDVSQADIYFTISNIINTLRNREPSIGKDGKPLSSLQQSAFVRNLLDPGNFDRFNDGIIQACLLRAACAEELAYDIDNDMSQEMFGTFETLIKYHEQEQGEALLEFLFALATKKLSLKPNYIEDVINIIRNKCKEEIIKCYGDYIEYVLFTLPTQKKENWDEELKNPSTQPILSQDGSMF